MKKKIVFKRRGERLLKHLFDESILINPLN